LQPLLLPTDAEAPVRGARYEELAGALRDDLLAGPINSVRIWRADGMILFADAPDLVGQRDPEMRDEIHAVTAGTSEGMVDGDRYRIITLLRVGESEEPVVAELGRSHVAMVSEAREPWYPWVSRGLTAAAVCAALYVATAIFFALFAGLEGRAARRRWSPREGRPARADRKASPAPNPDLPAYMQPGFQEDAQARRRVEEELEAVEKERDSLRMRVRHLESELEALKARSGEPVPDGDVVPLARR
jgi:hypothetical protein